MSQALEKISQFAVAAQGAYAFFTTPEAAFAALTQAGRANFTDVEAQRFLGASVGFSSSVSSGFELRDHQPNDPSGFSATVFYDRSSNKYVLGIRGSEDPADFVEDINRIGFQGFAGDQLVSLYRYYKKLTTQANQPVQYSDSEVSMLQAIRLGIGTGMASLVFNAARTVTLRGQLASDRGIVPEAGGGTSVLPPGAPLIVTGHSLGGHLALLFGRFFPEVTEHVYTYNAPGIGLQGELTLRALGIPPSPPSLVTNVSAAMGNEAISKIWSKPGENVGIATEPGSPLHQHAIVPLTDTLALYGAFGTLSPGNPLDAAAVSGIIAAASPFPEDSLEIVVDRLGELLDAGNLPTLIASAGSDLAARENYYLNLYGVLDSREPGLDYEIESLVGKTVVEIASMAVSDVSVRHALNELIPFHAKNADYSSFDGSVFSGSWIASRAEMLEAMLAGNLIDRPFGFAGSGDSIVYRDMDSGTGFSLLDGLQYQTALLKSSSPSDRQALFDYLDGATYKRSVVFGSNSGGDLLMGLSGGDRLFGGAGEDFFDGGSGDDYLSGGAGGDVLVGGSGDDTLDGEEGADHLEGGAGNDTYVFGPGLDADTIVDHDGEIHAGTTRLTGGAGGNGGNFLSGDDRFRYAFTGDLSAGGTLLVNESLRIENFRNGDLGIRLTDSQRPDPAGMPAAEAVLFGDSIYGSADEYGNWMPEGEIGSDPNRVDTYEEFQGTPGSTRFVAGGGNDVMQDVLGGNDLIELGAGDDAGWGGTGDDVVEGGSGRDIVAGGLGNDTLYAGSAAALEAALDDAALAERAEGGDLLSGGDGDDTIYGDAERNVVEGGAGNDRIFSGAGDDWIGADVAVLASRETYQGPPPNNDWINRVVDIIWPYQSPMITFSLDANGGFGSPAVAHIGGASLDPFYLDRAAGGDDEISAGAGNDTISAGGGDDQVFGGDGDDYIDAGGGADAIFGGDGRDYILVDWDAAGDYVDAGNGNDMVIAGDGDDILLGSGGDDRLLGSGGTNVLLGGDGKDFLSSTGDGSSLDGGAGDDMLFSRVSDDGFSRVHVGRGSGVDVLEAQRGTVIIDVAGDVSPSEVSVERTVHLIPAREGPAAFETLTGILVSVGTEGDAIFLADIQPADFQGKRSIEFADGTVWDNDYIETLVASPDVTGDLPAFTGTGAAELIYGSSGADTLSGGGGDDWLLGNAGDDAYLYAGGDGFDTIEDFDGTPGNADVLRFADGIRAEDMGVYAVGNDYLLSADTGGIRLRGGRTQEGAIERVEFSDGSFWSPGDFEARAEILPDNRAPSLPATLGSLSVDPGSSVEIVLPQDAIFDPDRFDSVSLYAIAADGEKLPGWLHFDAASRTLSGMPEQADRGVHELLIIAADANGAASVGSLTIAVGADMPVPDDGAPAVSGQVSAPALISAAPAPGETAVADSPAVRLDPAPRRQDDTFSVVAAAALPAGEPSKFGEPADPAFREIQHRTDVLLQTGRANLGERYAEAIREFEERRLDREREDASPLPPPTDEEVEAWNAAMHSWHDRNPGFAETELGGNDGIWSMGWGMPGPGDGALGGAAVSSSLPGLANPSALGRFQGVASAPALSEGIGQIR